MTRRELADEDVDAVELCTVGVDVGSSTSHVAFSRVRLQRLATARSSRFVVTSREELWRSPVELTPYEADSRIDAAGLAALVAAWQDEAGISFDRVDTGAVLLTGTALDRVNARVVAESVADGTGRFVCAAAGHHLEAELAAYGSGAVSLSATTDLNVLAVDIGGGTTKLASCQEGVVGSTAALAIGGRLLAWDADRRIVRAERAAYVVANELGVQLEIGAVLERPLEHAIAGRLARCLVGVLLGHAHDDLAEQLWLTERPTSRGPDIVTFSGGVAEYIEGRERRDFGDLGPGLAAALLTELAVSSASPKIVRALQGIRATVIGASQFSVQVSGSTVLVPQDAGLPVHGVPVVRPRLASERAPTSDSVAAAVRRGVRRRWETIESARSVALAFALTGEMPYEQLRELGEGIASVVRDDLAGKLDLLVVVVDRDLGESVGRILREDVGLASPSVVALDCLDLGDLDFLDLAARREPSGVVPVVVKSLLFAS